MLDSRLLRTDPEAVARNLARRIVPTSWLSTAEPLDSRRIGLLPPSEHCARLPREPARLLDPGHGP